METRAIHALVITELKVWTRDSVYIDVELDAD